MAKFTFDVEERLVRRVSVEASTEKAARAIVQAMYDNEELILNWSDLEECGIYAVIDPIDMKIAINRN